MKTPVPDQFLTDSTAHTLKLQDGKHIRRLGLDFSLLSKHSHVSFESNHLSKPHACNRIPEQFFHFDPYVLYNRSMEQSKVLDRSCQEYHVPELHKLMVLFRDLAIRLCDTIPLDIPYVYLILPCIIDRPYP